MTSTPNSYFTIAQLLDHWQQIQPEAIAIIAPQRQPLTYQQLHAQTLIVAQALAQLNIHPNEPVAIALPNSPEMAVMFLAVASYATCAPLNPNYRETEYEFYLSDLRPKALIMQSGVAEAARKVAEIQKIPIIELSPNLEAAAGIFSLNFTPASTAQIDPATPDDIALILHTSGTTSRPKIVPLTHHNLCTSANNISQTLQLTTHDCCLNVMPLFHIHGLIGCLLSTISTGASIICTPGFQAPNFLDWLEQLQPTWYSAVPTMQQMILERTKSTPDFSHHLRLIRSSSASLPPQVIQELEATFKVPVIEAYGMTEASHQMTSNPLPPSQRKPGSVGLPAGPEVAIMDEVGNFLAVGEVGEIVIRGTNVTQGYGNNPEANAKAFTQGWFRTGDQGMFDEDGYLTIKGRIKELINRGGEKIAPREIDELLLEHPSIGQAVAFAVPHSLLGEEVGVAVVLKEGKTVTEEEVQTFIAKSLADFKVPRRVVFLDAIPKGATGKLQRIGLAEKLGITFVEPITEVLSSIPPRTSLETVIANIWATFLKREEIGIEDNFYALGGQSLEAVEITSEIEDLFAIKLPLLAISKAPTVAKLAELMIQKSSQGQLLEIMAQQILDVANMEEEEIEQMLAEHNACAGVER
ncbi:AMP-binding protein [Aphanizomenon sp. PH219]|nr:AMP-binding protein [Aphanizomenon sp. 202]MDK2461247.1 AMP-binding protein [Aphanizomenon sp. PH219]